jgi:hypothetical protein
MRPDWDLESCSRKRKLDNQLEILVSLTFGMGHWEYAAK